MSSNTARTIQYSDAVQKDHSSPLSSCSRPLTSKEPSLGAMIIPLIKDREIQAQNRKSEPNLKHTKDTQPPHPLEYPEPTSADLDPAIHDAVVRKLIREIAPSFGLDAQNIRVHMNRSSRQKVRRLKASGLAEQGAIYLDDETVDPSTSRGRYLLGHELAHLAQQAKGRSQASRDLMNIYLAEWEARDIGHAVAHYRSFLPPHCRLPSNAPAADTALDHDVAVRYGREISRIRHLLAGWLGLWVTDGMVSEILLILQSFPFVVAQAIINNLDRDEQNRLVDEIDDSHFRRYREQILAAYSVMAEEILSRKDQTIFEGMEFSGLSDNEAVAVRHVLQYLPDQAVDALLQDATRGEAVEHIMDLGLDWSERQDERITRERQTEQREIGLRTERSRAEIDPQLSRHLQEIETVLRGRLRDAEALRILDLISRYLNRPDMFRVIAERLDDRDLLDNFVDEIPVSDLYEGPAHQRRSGELRVRTLVRLLSFRPAYLNVLIAQRLLRSTFAQRLVDWAVTDEDAYLAFQLIRAVPESVREGFLEEHGSTLRGELSQSMRESDIMNFYEGGSHQTDTAAIQAQLLGNELWSIENIATTEGMARITRLEGLIRMAIAAGERRWVFDRSRRAAEEDPETYQNRVFYNRIVAPFHLYLSLERNDQGEFEPRREYNPQEIEGTHWYEEGPLSLIHQLVQLIQTLSHSGNVSISGHSIGGEDLDASELQDHLGGNLLGVRFSRPEEMAGRGHVAGSPHPDTNLIEHASWDQSRGILQARASALSIEAVRYPVGSMTIQTERGTLEGFEVHIVAGTDEVPTSLHVFIDTLHLEDILVITSDGLYGANEANVNDLDVRMGQDAIRDQMTAPREGGRGWGIPIIGLPLRSIVNGIILISGRSSTRLSSALTETPGETPLSISIGAINVSGITTSSGQFIASAHIGELSVQMASTAEGLRTVLQGHRQRLSQLQQQGTQATTEDQRETIQQRIQRTERQIESLDRYFTTLDNARTEMAELIRRVEQDPENVADADRQRLALLREMMDQAARGGIVLDADEISATGLQGQISGEGLTLRNIRGTGQSAEGIINILTESNALQRILAGGAYQAPVLQSERHRGPGSFSAELGSMDIRELTVRSGLPDVEDLEEAHRRMTQRLARRPGDISLRDDCNNLALLIHQVNEYTQLSEIGVTFMDAGQLQRFQELHDIIYSREAFYVHHLQATGLRLQVGQRTGGVSLFAEQLDTSRPEAGRPGIRVDGVTVGEIHGTNVSVRSEIEGGLLSLDHLRDRVQGFGISGDHLQILDVSHGESGLSIEEINLDEFEATNDSIENALDIIARDGTISDIRFVRTPQSVSIALRETLLRLQSLPEEERARQSGRISELQQQIVELWQYMQLMAAVAERTESEEDSDRRAEIEELMQAIAQRYQLWQERLTIGGGRIGQTSVRITGLGNPLRQGFSLATAIEQGITITGTGDQGRMAESVSVSDVGIGPHDRIGSATGRQVSGSVELQGDNVVFRDFGVQRITVNQFAFNTSAGRISSNGQTTFSRVSLDGSIRYTEGNPAVSIRSLRIGNIESGHLRYQRGDLDITLREPPWPEGDAPSLREGEHRETRPPLRIEDIRVNNLEWSRETGPVPTGGSVQTGTIHGAVNLLWDSINLGAEIDARELNVNFSRGGRAVFLLPEVSGRVRGTAMGADIDTSFHEINTGEITYDHGRRQIDIPDFTIPWIDVHRILYRDDNLEISLPENSGGGTIHNITANMMIALNPSGSERSLNRIVIRDFYMETLDAWGVEVVLKNLNVAGAPRDISLRVPVEEQITMMGLHLEGNVEDSEGFVIQPPRSDEDRWHVFGSLQLESADVSLLRTCISDLLTVDAGIHARGLMVNLFRVGDYEIDLMNLDLDRIRLDAGNHHLVVDEGEHGSQLLERAGPGVSIEGFHRERDGTLHVDSATARGLVYYNDTLGIRVDISSFRLPEGARWETITPQALPDGSIRFPRIEINRARITIDNLMRLVGAMRSGASSGPSIPWADNLNILDSIDGNISFNASILNAPDIPINLPINMGRINYRDLENQLGVYDAIVDFRYSRGRLSLVVTTDNIADIESLLPPIVPHPPVPRISADVMVWQGMDAYERQLAHQGQVLISTLVQRYHSMPLITAIRGSGGGGGTAIEDYLQIQDINANINLLGSHIMNLGPYGHLQLGGNGNAITGLTVTHGNIPKEIDIGLNQASVSIAENQPLTIGSVQVDQGSLTVRGLNDTALHFDGFIPESFAGTINEAVLENLVLNITPSPAEHIYEADEQSEE